jgi:hypothetical protein
MMQSSSPPVSPNNNPNNHSRNINVSEQQMNPILAPAIGNNNIHRVGAHYLPASMPLDSKAQQALQKQRILELQAATARLKAQQNGIANNNNHHNNIIINNDKSNSIFCTIQSIFVKKTPPKIQNNNNNNSNNNSSEIFGCCSVFTSKPGPILAAAPPLSCQMIDKPTATPTGNNDVVNPITTINNTPTGNISPVNSHTNSRKKKKKSKSRSRSSRSNISNLSKKLTRTLSQESSTSTQSTNNFDFDSIVIDQSSSSSDSDNDSDNTSNSKKTIDMCVLHASPLVFIDHNARSLTPVKHLDNKNEKQQIQAVITKTKANVRCSFRHLSLEILGEELISNHDILHISGHGTHNNNVCDSSSYSLAFESDNGSVYLCSMNSLNRLLSTNPIPRLVVLSACFSEFAAKIFLNMGCQHVIAVKSNERILDHSARYFSKFFYMSLLNGNSVKQSFDIATTNVEIAHAASGSNNSNNNNGANNINNANSNPNNSVCPFILLPIDGNHDEIFFTKKNRINDNKRNNNSSNGSDFKPEPMSPMSPISTHSSSSNNINNLNNVNANTNNNINNNNIIPNNSNCPGVLFASISMPSCLHSNIPSLPTLHIGREIEIQRTVHLLVNSRFINIYGPEKYGKTSVAVCAAHYLLDRNHFVNGCYYISMNSLINTANNSVINESQIVKHICSILGIDCNIIINLIDLYRVIKDWNLLLLCDNCENQQSFNIIINLLNNTNNLKILSISLQQAENYINPIHIAGTTLDNNNSTSNNTITSTDNSNNNIHCSINISYVYIYRLSLPACKQLIARLLIEVNSSNSHNNHLTMNESDIVNLIDKCEQSPYQISLSIRNLARLRLMNRIAKNTPQLLVNNNVPIQPPTVAINRQSISNNNNPNSSVTITIPDLA